jgi:hypothetical protein
MVRRSWTIALPGLLIVLAPSLADARAGAHWLLSAIQQAS